MSRYDDRYEDRRDYYRRRNYDDYDDGRSSAGPPPSRRPVEATVVDRYAEPRRSERTGPRQPDFLREDYGRSTNAGPLVLRDERREDDYGGGRSRRRSLESGRSRAPPSMDVKAEYSYRERVRDYDSPGPPYPRSDRGGPDDKTEFVYRERSRSRPPPPASSRGSRDENIDIDINIDHHDHHYHDERSRVGSRRDYRERDVDVDESRYRRASRMPSLPPQAPMPPQTVEREEVRFRRETSRSRTLPHREFVDRTEVDFHDHRSPPPTSGRDSRGGKDIDIDIDINHSHRVHSPQPPPRQRSASRGNLVGKVHEEWVVRRRRSPSPEPPPPPRDYEREEIIIRRSQRSPSPEPPPPPPPREPTPEPVPPPPEPIIRPPIIQEVITHRRTIDYGVERPRSPTPPPPPPAPVAPPPREETKEDDLQIEIRRSGTRNGKSFDEDIVIESERKEQNRSRAVSMRRERSPSPRRAVSRGDQRRSDLASRPNRGRYDDVAAEADYYNRRVASRGYPGEAHNGATRDWELVDVPPGTSRVAMDGAGGGREEVTWGRYAGDRRSKFITGDRVYESGSYGSGSPAPAPLPPPAPAGPARETRSTEIRISEESRSGNTRNGNTWTEVTKDLVIKEAIEEQNYEYEDRGGNFYIKDRLRYVRPPTAPPPHYYVLRADLHATHRKTCSAWWKSVKTSAASGVNGCARSSGSATGPGCCPRRRSSRRLLRVAAAGTTNTSTSANATWIAATGAVGIARGTAGEEVVEEGMPCAAMFIVLSRRSRLGGTPVEVSRGPRTGCVCLRHTDERPRQPAHLATPPLSLFLPWTHRHCNADLVALT